MHKTIEAMVVLRPETDQLRFLPEGPYWLGEETISWVAIQHGSDAASGSLNLFNLQTGENRTYDLPGRPGFAFPCSGRNQFLIGLERDLGIFDIETKEWRVLVGGIDKDVEGTIINDGLIWGDHVIFGTKDLEFAAPKANLYLFRGRDSLLFKLCDNQTCSNGKGVRMTEQGPELVDIDSPTRKVVGYSLDVASGKIGAPRTLLDLTEDPAVPDGAILTPDGKSVIISMYNPNAAPHGETRQYSLHTGGLECVWETPGSPQNTCPALVNYQGKVCILITTAVEHMPKDRWDQAPYAGCLFLGATDFPSLPEYPVWQV